MTPHTDTSRPRVLLTGATGMLGGYILPLLGDCAVTTLGRHDAGIVCDLTRDTPRLGTERFDTVLHLAGTCRPDTAMALNFDGTCRLLDALADTPPAHFLYVSSTDVYGRDEGETLDEDTYAWATSEAGKSKIMAEQAIRRRLEPAGTIVTVVRPATMLGSGAGGEMARMFSDVAAGTYLHVRDNEGALSLVTAYDTARCIAALYRTGGTYNITDGRTHSYRALAEAMSANAGSRKRMTTLPAKWARLLWRLARFVPAVDRNYNPAVVALRGRRLTFSNARAAADSGLDFHDTLEVLARRDRSYPYADPD